jgi:putative ABC transport system ATP-binding protein
MPARGQVPAAGRIVTVAERGEVVLRAQGVSRVFGHGSTEVHACTDIDLQVHAGELLVVKGPSGAGKTTLLNLLGGLDRPTSGQVYLGDRELSAMSEKDLVDVRREEVGYVFQSFGLIPILSAAENVEIPLRLLAMDPDSRTERVRELLGLVGLEAHAEQRPYELSGGQQQRVGIARALAGNPRVLIADEPTAQLDTRTGAAVMTLVHELVRDRGLTAVVATHDPALISLADRALELRDGRIGGRAEGAAAGASQPVG